jgi:uncharacterized membrane protein
MFSARQLSRVVPDPHTPDETATLGHINSNIESMVAFHEREQDKRGPWQQSLERIGPLVGRPVYLASLASVVVTWVANAIARALGYHAVDPPPFAWLQGLLTLVAILTTTVVLITQNGLAKLEQQRAHLDLQVNLLTEQKVTTVIRLLEELRRDLPMVKDRHDAEANALQQRTDTAQVLAALTESSLEAAAGVRSGGGASGAPQGANRPP